MAKPGLYGSDDALTEEATSYKSPAAYNDQGDTRCVRDVMFSYLVATKDAAGNDILSSRDAPRGTYLRTDQIGLIKLKMGEENNSFYTTDQLEALEGTGSETPPVAADTDLTSLGEYELAQWLQTGKDGGAFTVDEVLEAVGNDKDLANRMLAAENIATQNDPRAGVEKGLTVIIERQ